MSMSNAIDRLNRLGFRLPHMVTMRNIRFSLMAKGEIQDSTPFPAWAQPNRGLLDQVTVRTTGTLGTPGHLLTLSISGVPHNSEYQSVTLDIEFSLPTSVEPGSRELAAKLNETISALQEYLESVQARLVEGML